MSKEGAVARNPLSSTYSDKVLNRPCTAQPHLSLDRTDRPLDTKHHDTHVFRMLCGAASSTVSPMESTRVTFYERYHNVAVVLAVHGGLTHTNYAVNAISHDD